MKVFIVMDTSEYPPGIVSLWTTPEGASKGIEIEITRGDESMREWLEVKEMEVQK